MQKECNLLLKTGSLKKQCGSTFKKKKKRDKNKNESDQNK